MAECLCEQRQLRVRSIEHRAPPQADILLDLDSGQLIALEVRGLTDPRREESLEARRQIGLRAERLLAGARINAHVAWEPDSVVPAKRIDRLAAEIASVVFKMQADGVVAIGDLAEVPAPLKPYVAAVSLFPPVEDGPRVRTTQQAWTGTGAVDSIQAAIGEKEAKLADYRSAHPGREVWLLLWTNAGESQPLTVSMLDRSHMYRTGFDQVFVLDYARRESVALVTEASSRPR